MCRTRFCILLTGIYLLFTSNKKALKDNTFEGMLKLKVAAIRNCLLSDSAAHPHVASGPTRELFHTFFALDIDT